MRVLRELKRRKVLHTLSLYIVGCWVALQVIEVLSDAGLPPATMRFVLFAMSFGFPVVLLIAWFYDVSAAGISRTPPAQPGEALPKLNPKPKQGRRQEPKRKNKPKPTNKRLPNASSSIRSLY